MDSSTSKMSGSLNHSMIDDAQAKRTQAYADHFGEPGFNDPSQLYIDQRYEGYSRENQEAWTSLFDRQMAYLADHASNTYLTGAKVIKLERSRIPPLDVINSQLKPLTGWQSKG